MNVLDAIQARRSVKKFLPQPVDHAILTEMLAAAVRAPNHRLTNPWHFYVLTGEGLGHFARIRVQQMREGGDVDDERVARLTQELATLPALILVACNQGRNEEEHNENYAATAMAIHNMWLVAISHGLGCIWRSGRILESEPLRQWLGLGPDQYLVSTFYVGYPEVVPAETPRTPWQEKTTWVTE